MLDIKAALDRIVVNEQLQHDIVHGNNTAQITTDAGSRPSVSKLQKDAIDAAHAENTAFLADIIQRIAVLESNAPANVAPIANNITASVEQDGSVVIPISATDSDGTIDLTSVVVTTAPAHGTHSINATSGDITYIPTTNYFGADSISYTVADNDGAVSNVATISITVNELGAIITAYTVAAGQTLYAGENASDFIQYTTTGDSIYAGENP